jgi:lipoyl synthase
MKSVQVNHAPVRNLESPDYVRVSLAAAMTLGFVPGWFYRNARLGCINLLMTYADGCTANCAFCGLAAEKRLVPSAGRFIRVAWKTYALDDVIEAIGRTPDYVTRVCISMITHPQCKRDVLTICRRVADETGKAVSLLISPTILHREDLEAMKTAGAERIGVAVDAATPELFARLRGKPVHGPHQWKKYWDVFRDSLSVFGPGMAGVHLICGLGETEQELVTAIATARKLGGFTHLFSFYPERGSLMESQVPPPMGTYRRIQLARWLIDTDMANTERMDFDENGMIRDFGVSEALVRETIVNGTAFETSGCPGPDGRVACNRPFANEKPGPNIRNFPFPPEKEDMEKIAGELKQYET